MCPKVIVLNELSERAKFGRGHISFDERTVEIYEKAQFTELDLIEVLAHEMRHCWQHDKYCEKFFLHYKYSEEYNQACREQYMLQPAEIDANAYALRFVRAATGEDFEANTIFTNVNREIDQ